MLNIYIRKDLNMRKGKMAAQSAHAAMKLLLESMHATSEKMVLSEEKEKDLLLFLNNPQVNIIYVRSEEELKEKVENEKAFSIIVDNGRTEFHGVQTTTCAASGIFNKNTEHELYVPHTYGEEIKAKQIIIYSKECPLSKENTVKLAVISCLKIIYKKMVTNNNSKYIDLNEDNEMSAWINGAFGKIAVSVKTDKELDILCMTLEENNIVVIEENFEQNKCLIVEPKYPQEIDIFTKHLSLI